MQNCNQADNFSVLDHGKLVNQYYIDLVNHLKNSTPLEYNWKLPNWIYENKEDIVSNLYDVDIMTEYQVYHDCGKSYSLEIDENGRRHFPNHAQVSYGVYMQLFNNPVVGELILHDMDIHTFSSEEISELCNTKDKNFLYSLLLTSLSELHANANVLFGGLESINFKIKYKQIDKRGKQIIKTNIS